MTTTLSDLTFEEKIGLRSNDTSHIEFNFGDATFSGGKIANISVGGTDYRLSEGSFRQIAEHLSIPVPFARRVPSDLIEYNVNYLLNKNRSNKIGALVENGTIRSFMKADLPYVSYSEMFETVKNAVGDDYDLRYAKIDDTRTSFSILPSSYIESVDGTNLYGGIKVAFSDAWDIHPTIDSYIWREICSNGMINELEKRKFRVAGSTHDDVLRQINDFSVIAIEKLPELFESFARLVDEPVDDYVKILRKVILEHKLPNKVLTRLTLWATHPSFLETITNDRIMNMNDVVNLLTYTGSHDTELTPEIRQRLMEIAGNLTLSHHERCESCGGAF